MTDNPRKDRFKDVSDRDIKADPSIKRRPDKKIREGIFDFGECNSYKSKLGINSSEKQIELAIPTPLRKQQNKTNQFTIPGPQRKKQKLARRTPPLKKNKLARRAPPRKKKLGRRTRNGKKSSIFAEHSLIRHSLTRLCEPRAQL